MAKLPVKIDNFPLKIDKLVPGGQGITVIDYDFAQRFATARETILSDRERALLPPGKKGFVWNALPGETVTSFTITKSKSHYFEAIAETIENPLSHRIAPQDSCYLATSPWQIMDYDYELEQKRELLLETFRQHGLEIEPGHVMTDGNDLFYRNKMEYSLYWDIEESKIKLAQHQRGSHRKIPLETSSIERPEIWQKANEIIADLNARHEEARKYQSLLLRCDQNGEVSGGLYENKKPHPVFDNLTDTILGYEYSYSPNGFFQINLPVYEMALKEIKKHITTDKVLDLYSGVGTIGLSVARDKELTLVECNKFAYEELVKNCLYISSRAPVVRPVVTGELPILAPRRSRRSRDRNITPILSNSEDTLGYIAPDQTVILDPPRAGCDIKLLEKLNETRPRTIIYLSCNPATQARDLAILIEKYKITSITPYNFFPRTPHLENLVVLQAK